MTTIRRNLVTYLTSIDSQFNTTLLQTFPSSPVSLNPRISSDRNISANVYFKVDHNSSIAQGHLSLLGNPTFVFRTTVLVTQLSGSN